MKIEIELSEKELRQFILSHLSDLYTGDLKEEDVIIEVKSKQNYKSEWEPANFRARISKTS
jgi:hypothetical protein